MLYRLRPSCRQIVTRVSGRIMHTRKAILLEEGDIEEGLKTAAAIGDDQMMKRAGQYIRPDAFTHGTSKQRGPVVSHWTKIGRHGIL